MKRLLSFCSILALLSLPILAQTFGEITGEIRDSSGALVPGVKVTIISAATNATRRVETNDAGIYSAPSLPPGIYSLRAEKQGFKSATAASMSNASFCAALSFGTPATSCATSRRPSCKTLCNHIPWVRTCVSTGRCQKRSWPMR